MTIPDPTTPALLSAARLDAAIVEAIVADLSDRRGLRHEWQAIDDDIREEIKATWIGIVGRHLAALTPPAAPDGEALGRAVADVVEAHDYRPAHDDPGIGPAVLTRSMCERIGTALHAIGYAAGRSEGEAERAAERARFEDDAAIERDDADAEIARLTAELAEARATLASVRERHEEERADLQCEIAQGESMLASAAADHEAARRDGAREERAAIVEQIRQWAAEGAPGMPEDGDETLVDWIATEIEGRPRGEGQGS